MTTTLGTRRLIGGCFGLALLVSAVLVIGGWLAGPEYMAFVWQGLQAVIGAAK